MPNYLRLVGEHFPNTDAYVPTGGDPTIYNDIVWMDTPIAQATLDALSTGEETLVTRIVAQLATINAGDVLQWDGANFAPVTSGDVSTGAGAVGKLFEIPFQRNGSVSNDWLLTDDLPTNSTPIIIPFDSELVGLTFSNSDETSKTELEFRCVAEGGGAGPSILKYTWILDNVRTARKSNFVSPVTFSQGDMVAVFAKKRGAQQDPKNVKLVAHFIVTVDNQSESLNDWTGDIT